MITMDITRLVSDKSLEKQVVKYVADAIGGYSDIPNHRYLAKTYSIEEVVQAADELTRIYAYGWKDPITTGGTVEVDESKFFFGNQTILLYAGSFAGEWAITVTMRVPGLNLGDETLPSPQVFYTSSFTMDYVPYTTVRLDLPMVPTFNTQIVLSTGAASSLYFHAAFMYSGLFFGR